MIIDNYEYDITDFKHPGGSVIHYMNGQDATNAYSLLFSVINIASSSLWIKYSQLISDVPLLVRSSSDVFLLSIYYAIE